MLETNEILLMIKDFSNYYHKKNIRLYTKGYDYLIDKLSNEQGITQPEYTFLCWLNYNDREQFQISINKPHIPEIITMSANDFSGTFSSNSHRKDLYSKLLCFLKIKNDVFNCQYIDLLIGGSYTDKNKPCPSDIDCAMLLEKKYIDDFPAACNNHCDSYQGQELDIKFLNKECSYKHLLTYLWISRLGNEATIKDKENEYSVKNNNFKKRQVFRVRFQLGAANN